MAIRPHGYAAAVPGGGLSTTEVNALIAARYTDAEKAKLLALHNFLEKTIHVPGALEDELNSSHTTHTFPAVTISDHHRTLRTSGAYEVVAKITMVAFPTAGNTNGLEAMRFEFLDGSSDALVPAERTAVVGMPNAGEQYTIEHTFTLPATLDAFRIQAQRVGNGQSIELVSMTAEVYLGAIPVDGSVTEMKLADGAVSLEKAKFFERRETTAITTPAVAAVAATLDYDVDARPMETVNVRFTAAAAGAAGNAISVKIFQGATAGGAYDVVVNGNALNIKVNNNIPDAATHAITQASFAASMNGIASVSNLVVVSDTGDGNIIVGNLPASAAAAVTPLAGGVTGVAEVTETTIHEPALGDGLILNAAGKFTSDNVLTFRTGEPQVAPHVEVITARFLAASGITLPNTLKRYQVNWGRGRAGDPETGSWIWIDCAKWLALVPAAEGDEVSGINTPDNALYFPGSHDRINDVWMARTTDYEILLTTSGAGSDFHVFQIREVL